MKRSPSVDTNTLVEQKSVELGQFRTTYENLSISIRAFSGKIPLPVMQQLSEVETKIEELTQEIEAIEAASPSAAINIDDYKTIIDLFMTEEGRAKINTFFKENDIVFYAEHDKQSTLSQLKIARVVGDTNEELIHSSAFLPKKQILKAWNLTDLQDMFDLSV